MAWSALWATTLLLALVMQTLAAQALGPPQADGPAAALQAPTGAALTDATEARLRFLAIRRRDGSIAADTRP